MSGLGWFWLGLICIAGGIVLATYRSGPGEQLLGGALIVIGGVLAWRHRRSGRDRGS